MDFATRDAYRHAVEELARGSARPELDVAREAVAHARGADEEDERQNDPGFSLIGNGRLVFERALGYRAPPMRQLLRIYVETATLGYLGTIVLLSCLLLTLPLLAAEASGVEPMSLLVLILLAAIPASSIRSGCSC
jgi:cyclic beta-1,2-glucan synthetase